MDNFGQNSGLSCNLQNPPGQKFRVQKRGHVLENQTYGSPNVIDDVLRPRHNKNSRPVSLNFNPMPHGFRSFSNSL